VAGRFVVGRRQRQVEGEAERGRFASSFRPVLDVVRLHNRAPLFWFGVPWGWLDLNDGQLKALQALTGIVTERPDDSNTTIAVFGPYDIPELNGPDGHVRLTAYAGEIAEARTQAPRTSGIGPVSLSAPPQEVVLAGDPALVIRLRQLVDSGVPGRQDEFWADAEVWTVHGGRPYNIQMSGPEVDTPAYEADFHTVLGTWQWRS
jgi:hypothetical protein